MRVRGNYLFGVLVAAALIDIFGSASGADLRRDRPHRAPASDVYAEDYACPLEEPREYKPRIANFNQPLCYAARPYGISAHTYDRPRELRDRFVGY